MTGTFEQQLLACCRENDLLARGDTVAVAVSGGADSMALLTALYRQRDTLGIRLLAAHFHHGLRGAEADRDEAFVRSWCQAHSIPLAVGRGDVRAHAAKTGQSIETAARELRYAFLETLAADRIATAHTADDNAETVLQHLLRGAGPRGLAGIPPKRARLIRPLLFATRSQIEQYLQAQKTPYCQDSTNDADDCLRNRLRHRVMPLLRAENPNFAQTLTRSSTLLRQEDAYLSALAAQTLASCRMGEGWSCSALLALEPVLRRRALISLLQALQLAHPAQSGVNAIESLLVAASPSARVDLPEDWIARRSYDLLLLEPRGREDGGVCPTVRLAVPGETVLAPLSWRIRAVVTENSNFSVKNLNTFALRYDMISAADWSVRTRCTGDRLLMPYGSRSVKRLMIDSHIPAAQRAQLPVVLCGGEIACVLGLARSEAFVPLPGQPALVLTLLCDPVPAAGS